MAAEKCVGVVSSNRLCCDILNKHSLLKKQAAPTLSQVTLELGLCKRHCLRFAFLLHLLCIPSCISIAVFQNFVCSNDEPIEDALFSCAAQSPPP